MSMTGPDDSEKTEEPTNKRITDARERGQVANSREINTLFMLLAAALILAILGPGLAASVRDTLAPFIAYPHAIPTEGVFLRDLFHGMVATLAWAAVVAIAIVVVAALLGGLIQNGPLLTTHTIIPRLNKISPITGLKRLFSLRSVVEFVKNIAKLAVVAAVAAAVMLPQFRDLEQYVGMDAGMVLAELHRLALMLLAAVVAVMAVIAVADLVYQRYEHFRKMRMSKQEVKDEHKQMEGDPMIKARLRAIRLEKARRRMMQQVPEADVVITNPTHFAVALKYDNTTMEAPVLVAKGADLVAYRIREIALEHKVPIVENPPLSRALYAGVEIDQPIPVEHYQAVAEIIGYVWRLKGRMPRPAGQGQRRAAR